MWLPPFCLLLVCGVAIACFVAGVFVKVKRRGVLLILATIAVAALVLWCVETLRYQPVARAYGTEIALSVEVQTSGLARVTGGDLPKEVTLCLPPDTFPKTWSAGDVIQGTFRIDSLGAHGLNLLQNKAYGLWGVATPTDAHVVSHNDPTVWTVFAAWRRSVAAEICRVLPQDVGAVISGICLGEDGNLSADVVGDFRACGVSHLFAVSGLHLSVLTQTLLSILKRCRIPRRVRGVLGATAVIGFIFLMDPTASVMRAGAMCFLIMVGECFRRQADARNSMGLALIILLGGDPFAVYDAGLLLSFSATCGILFLSAPIQTWLCRLPTGRVLAKPWQSLSSVLSVTLAASITTLPITMVFFGSFSVMGILANPLVTLPATVILVLGWITILPVTLRMTWIYRPLLLILGFLSRLVLSITAWLGSIETSSIAVTVWFLGSGFLIYGGYRLFRYRGVCITSAVSIGLFCVII